MKNEQQRLQTQINLIQSQLEKLPEGKLFCTRNGSYYKWYQSLNHQITYIPRKNRPYAEKLAAKQYLAFTLEELIQKKKAVDAYLSQYPKTPKKSEQLLTAESGLRELVLPYFKPDAQLLSDWMKAPYEKNTKHLEQLIHKTISGNLVRSKSEAMIDMCLFTHHIPFRYEAALVLGDITLFPDFTICHPETGKLYYWEHFGLMDDSSYSKNTFSKLQHYNSYGITPGIQLITTYETSANPLSFETIENVVSHYFA